jgi:molybdate transport system substrate-binding protein
MSISTARYTTCVFGRMAALIAVLLVSSPVSGAPLRVAVEEEFATAYKALAPEFERASGSKLASTWGPSMGSSKDAIPERLARGERIDVVIMVGFALEQLVKQGKVLPDGRIALARSRIGAVVRAGANKPDIGSLDALRRTLLAAKSVAYPDSPSGVYISHVLFPRLGIAEQMKDKAHRIAAVPVATLVAKGKAEIGFERVSALLPVRGVDFVGVLPSDVEEVTVFSAGIVAGPKQPEAARALLRFLSSPAAAPVIRKTGLEPAVD